MSDPLVQGMDAASAGREEMLAALFAQMVVQQANMAMLLMGKVPHPQTGETVRDLEGARMFIDQLEMLEARTKGNLSREEQQLLKQSLMQLQLAFVEAVESPATPAQPAPAPAAAAPEAAPTAPVSGNPPAPAAEDDAGRKKFSRKY